MNSFEKEIVGPQQCREIEPRLNESMWVYKYRHPQHDWLLSVATAAEKGSGKFSLGGFRIAPEERVNMKGYSNDREAIDLAIGMQEKVYWSRLIHIGGPRALENIQKIVGGKCVLLPSADARVGKVNDRALLDFAAMCLNDLHESAGIQPITGQDLGHGTLSDGSATSLEYLHERFAGSVLEDTSKPTAEGNFYLLRGALRAAGLELSEARVGLIGCGNIGFHILERLREHNASIIALEARESTKEKMQAMDIQVFGPADKEQFLGMQMDALVVNANGGTLDPKAVEVICANESLQIVCGCENLVMPDPASEEVLRSAKKVFCPTELCGMMGYLTAVEEFLCARDGVSLDLEDLFQASKKLEEAGERATSYVRENDHKVLFEDAVKAVYSE